MEYKTRVSHEQHELKYCTILCVSLFDLLTVLQCMPLILHMQQWQSMALCAR